MARMPVVLLAVVFGATAAIAAFEPNLDPSSLSDAIQLGQSMSDTQRANFHAPYHFISRVPPVDSIDVVTPFRRIVLDAESNARAGNRAYGQRLALATLADDPSRVDIVADLSFHPQNTYIGVPDFAVTLIPDQGDPIQPRNLERVSRFGPKLGGLPLPYPYTTGAPQAGGKQPLLGGLVIATFDGKALDPEGVYVVMVTGREGEPAKVRVDFSKLR